MDLLIELCQIAGEEAIRNFGRRLGTEAGRRVAERLGDGTKEASIATLLDHLGGEMALMGLGNLGVEQWGRALVMTVEGAPAGREGNALLAAVLEGAIQRAFGRDSSVVELLRDDDLLRLLVVSPATAESVRSQLGSGCSWGQVLATLHSKSASKGGGAR
jgi:hypothetical protein